MMKKFLLIIFLFPLMRFDDFFAYGTRQAMLKLQVSASRRASYNLATAVTEHQQALNDILIILYTEYDLRTFLKHARQEIEEELKMPVQIDTDSWDQKYADKCLSTFHLLNLSLNDLDLAKKYRVSIEVQ